MSYLQYFLTPALTAFLNRQRHLVGSKIQQTVHDVLFWPYSFHLEFLTGSKQVEMYCSGTNNFHFRCWGQPVVQQVRALCPVTGGFNTACWYSCSRIRQRQSRYVHLMSFPFGTTFSLHSKLIPQLQFFEPSYFAFQSNLPVEELLSLYNCKPSTAYQQPHTKVGPDRRSSPLYYVSFHQIALSNH